MLLGLRFNNFALIDSLELDFKDGFTVLTGETGAGKSLLLGALDSLFGSSQYLSADRFLRTNTDKCHLEASFSVSPALNNWLNLNSFDSDYKEILLSREWRLKDNRLSSRCRLNGTVINLEHLKSLRPLLIDFTFQGQIQDLASVSRQLFYLDSIGSKKTKDALREVKSTWHLWQQASLDLEAIKLEHQKSKDSFLYSKESLDELELLNIEDPYEDKKLQNEQDRLLHSFSLKTSLSKIKSIFQEGADQIPSISEQLSYSIHELQAMNKIDNSVESYVNKALDLQLLFQELNTELDNYFSLLEDDPFALEECQTRLALIKKIQRKYNCDLPALLKLKDNLTKIVYQDEFDSKLELAKNKELELRKLRDLKNINLSQLRKENAIFLEKKLLECLKKLSLPNIRFKILLKDQTPSEKGSDFVQFLFSANPGHSLEPLEKIASGGEMSRFLLAFKAVLSEVDGSTTLVFDEIDSGVSGRVSAAIAKLLHDLSTHRQVFCVTHQPIIAAKADHHFSISKSVVAGKTFSNVCYLKDLDARQKELAELAGGDSDDARAYAASLLDRQVA